MKYGTFEKGVLLIMTLIIEDEDEKGVGNYKDSLRAASPQAPLLLIYCLSVAYYMLICRLSVAFCCLSVAYLLLICSLFVC